MRPQIRYNERFAKALSVRQNYESHKIKLNQLSRKKGPYAMNLSISKLEEIKNRKSYNLMRTRTKKQQLIQKQNNTIFERLIASQQSSRKTYVANATIDFLRQDSSQRIMTDKPYIKRTLQSAQSQNQRLFGRLTTLKSTIDKKKMKLDYNNYNERKNRISKFQGSCLKKNKFVQKQFSKRSISHRSAIQENFTQPISIKDTKSTLPTNFTKQHYTSLYNAQQVFKHKIQQPNIITKSIDPNYLDRIKQLNRIAFRPFNDKLITDITKFVDQNNNSCQAKRFFATQIENLQPRSPSIEIKNIKK